jgi:hypothetical protein
MMPCSPKLSPSLTLDSFIVISEEERRYGNDSLAIARVVKHVALPIIDNVEGGIQSALFNDDGPLRKALLVRQICKRLPLIFVQQTKQPIGSKPFENPLLFLG